MPALKRAHEVGNACGSATESCEMILANVLGIQAVFMSCCLICVSALHGRRKWRYYRGISLYKADHKG